MSSKKHTSRMTKFLFVALGVVSIGFLAVL